MPVKLPFNKVSNRFQCIFFQPAHLSLRDADFISNFCLCFPLKESFFNNVIFPSGKLIHGFLEREMLDPGVFFIFLVANLIHQKQRVISVLIDWFEKGHGGGNRIQGINNIFLGNFRFFGNFLQSWGCGSLI